MRIENVFRALMEGKIVKSGMISFRISSDHRLESRYNNGSWVSVTELLNNPDWIGTEDEYKLMLEARE